MFRKADALHPGALDLLSKKGLQIFAQREHDGSPLGVLGVLQQAKADLVTAYCSYGRLVEEKVPGATWMILPPALDVASQYGIGSRRTRIRLQDSS